MQTNHTLAVIRSLFSSSRWNASAPPHNRPAMTWAVKWFQVPKQRLHDFLCDYDEISRLHRVVHHVPAGPDAGYRQAYLQLGVSERQPSGKLKFFAHGLLEQMDGTVSVITSAKLVAHARDIDIERVVSEARKHKLQGTFLGEKMSTGALLNGYASFWQTEVDTTGNLFDYLVKRYPLPADRRIKVVNAFINTKRRFSRPLQGATLRRFINRLNPKAVHVMHKTGIESPEFYNWLNAGGDSNLSLRRAQAALAYPLLVTQFIKETDLTQVIDLAEPGPGPDHV